MKHQFRESLLHIIDNNYGVDVTPRGAKKKRKRQQSFTQFVTQLQTSQNEEAIRILMEKAQERGLMKKRNASEISKSYYEKYIMPHQSHNRNRKRQLNQSQQIIKPASMLEDVLVINQQDIKNQISKRSSNSVTQVLKSQSPKQERRTLKEKPPSHSQMNLTPIQLLKTPYSHKTSIFDSQSQNNKIVNFMADDKLPLIQTPSNQDQVHSKLFNQFKVGRNSATDQINNKVTFLNNSAQDLILRAQHTMKPDQTARKRLSSKNHTLGLVNSQMLTSPQAAVKLMKLVQGFGDGKSKDIQVSALATIKAIEIPRLTNIFGKDSPLTEEVEQIFRKISQVGQTDQNQHLNVLKNIRVAKGQLRQYLAKRYKKLVADKILQNLDTSAQSFLSTDITHYLKMLDDLIHTPSKAMEMTFAIYDISSNNRVCYHDLFQVMSLFKEEQSQVFINAFSSDICQIQRGIDQKIKQGPQFQKAFTSALSKSSSPLLIQMQASVKRATKIEKLNNIISALHSQNNSPKTQYSDSLNIIKNNSAQHTLLPAGRNDSLHSQFHDKRCEFLTKAEFIHILHFKDGYSSIVEDIITYLSGFSLKTHFKKERRFQPESGMRTNKEQQMHKMMAVSLKQTKSRFQKNEADNLERVFLKLCKNKGDDQSLITSLYINEESFVKNFASVFYYENSYLAKRIFNSISNYHPQQRLYLEQYYERMYPILYGSQDTKNKLAFQVYDGNNKGYISSIDLEEFFQKIIPCTLSKSFIACECPLYQEVRMFTDEYIANNVVKYSSKSKILMTFEFFINRLEISCLYKEIVDRLTDNQREKSILRACININQKIAIPSPSNNKQFI